MEDRTPTPDERLILPVGRLAAPGAILEADASLRLAMDRIRATAVVSVAVVREGALIGIVDESTVLEVAAAGADLDAPVGDWARPVPTLSPYASGSEALRTLERHGLATLWVVDDHGRPLGVFRPSTLWANRFTGARPPMVGGMATPFGVYLTNGALGAGAQGWPLVATGFLLFTLLTLAQAVGWWISGFVAPEGSPGWWVAGVESVVPLALFLFLMRALPISGTHAAEHQTVHAIERGEELRPEVVRRMPRVHPRCGTNLAVGISLFLSLAGGLYPLLQELGLLLSLVLAGAFWRPLGNLVQSAVTTKPANDAQLASGIRAGKELLERYQSAGDAVPTIPRRILSSGMIHVIAGSLLAFGFWWAVARLTGLDLGL